MRKKPRSGQGDSKIKGYSYVPDKTKTADRPYHAQITIKGKTVALGYFATAKEATEAYKKARLENPPGKRGPKKGEPRL